jgi:hypothetical protein
MTSITTNSLTNNLSLTNQNSNFPIKSGLASKISNLAHTLYLGPAYVNVPGLSNIFFTPYDLYKSAAASVRAYKIGDKEGIIENGLRVVGAPFTLLNALLQLTWYGIQAGLFFKLLSQSFASVLAPLSKRITGAGIIFSAIEGILKIFNIIRSECFLYNNYPSELEPLKKIIEIQDPGLRQQKFLAYLEQFLRKHQSDPIKVEIDSLLKRKDLSQTEFLQLSELSKMFI